MKLIKCFLATISIFAALTKQGFAAEPQKRSEVTLNTERLLEINQRLNEIFPIEEGSLENEQDLALNQKLAESLRSRLEDSQFRNELFEVVSELQTFFATGNVLIRPSERSADQLKAESHTVWNPLVLVLSRTVLVNSIAFLSKDLIHYSGTTKLKAGIIGLFTMGFGGLYYERSVRSKHTNQKYNLSVARDCSSSILAGAYLGEHCKQPDLSHYIAAYTTARASWALISEMKSSRLAAKISAYEGIFLIYSRPTPEGFGFYGKEYISELWEKILWTGELSWSLDISRELILGIERLENGPTKVNLKKGIFNDTRGAAPNYREIDPATGEMRQ